MKYKKNRRHILLLVALIFGVVSFFGSADAMQFNPSSDTTIDCDITVNYGAGWRVSDRDDNLVYDPRRPTKTNPSKVNLDDGDWNFDQGDMISNKLSVIADIDVQHKNVGLFFRPKAFYDHVYMTDNSNPFKDAETTPNNMQNSRSLVYIDGSPTVVTGKGLIKEGDEWDDEIEHIHGRNVEVLDLYAYSNFELADRLAEIRIGRQVVSWGTSLLISGGISSAQSHVDVAAAAAVGTEVKEIFLPSEQLYFSLNLSENVTLSTYYQWMYHKSVLYEGGTFYATTDFVDKINAPVLGIDSAGNPYGYLPKANDDNPRRGGQYGVALTYKPAFGFLNQTEFGLYYINYHDKLPQFHAGYPYFLSYTEDIQLYGFSFDTAIGDANIAGEFSYRDDYIFRWSGADKVEGNYYQAQLSGIYAVAFDPIADRVAILGEVACIRVLGVADKYQSINKDVANPFASQAVLRLGFDWYQVLRDLDLSLSLAYAQTMSGTTIKNLGFYEGAEVGSIGFSFLYQNIYKASVTYENRFNTKSEYSTADRDTIKLALSYTF